MDLEAPDHKEPLKWFSYLAERAVAPQMFYSRFG